MNLVQTLLQHPTAPFFFNWMPVIVNVCMCIPAWRGLRRWVGVQRATLVWVVVGMFALTFEGQALHTGWPYSHFWYTKLAGWQVFGIVPLVVGISFSSLVLGAVYMVWRWWHSRWASILAGAVWLVGVDIALDPVATQFGIWQWASEGWYYGVPLQNFFGWLVAGILAMVLARVCLMKVHSNPPPVVVVPTVITLVSSLVFSVVFGFWVSVVVSMVLLYAVYVAKRKHDATFTFSTKH